MNFPSNVRGIRFRPHSAARPLLPRGTLKIVCSLNWCDRDTDPSMLAAQIRGLVHRQAIDSPSHPREGCPHRYAGARDAWGSTTDPFCLLNSRFLAHLTAFDKEDRKLLLPSRHDFFSLDAGALIWRSQPEPQRPSGLECPRYHPTQRLHRRLAASYDECDQDRREESHLRTGASGTAPSGTRSRGRPRRCRRRPWSCRRRWPCA